MLTTVEVILQPRGTLQFLEPIYFDKPRRVLVTFTNYNDEVLSGLALSESVLADDWLRDEEEQAWAYLQAVR